MISVSNCFVIFRTTLWSLKCQPSLPALEGVLRQSLLVHQTKGGHKNQEPCKPPAGSGPKAVITQGRHNSTNCVTTNALLATPRGVGPNTVDTNTTTVSKDCSGQFRGPSDPLRSQPRKPATPIEAKRTRDTRSQQRRLAWLPLERPPDRRMAEIVCRASPGLRPDSPEGVEGAAEAAGVGRAVGGEPTGPGVAPEVFFILVFSRILVFFFSLSKERGQSRRERREGERERERERQGGRESERAKARAARSQQLRGGRKWWRSRRGKLEVVGARGREGASLGNRRAERKTMIGRDAKKVNT